MNIHIIGVPMDLGQQRRGVDMGPSAIRYAGLQKRLEQLGHQVIDGGNIDVPTPEETPDPVLDQRNRTAELAVGLTASLLGKRIL